MAVPAEYRHPAPPEGRSFPLRSQPWSVEEALALPEDRGRRVELLDGAVHVSPAPGYWHQKLQQRLAVALDPLVPPGLELVPGVNVVLGPQRLLIPDLAILVKPDRDALHFQAGDVLLAVEVMSPSSRTYDKVFKREVYAEAGIPHFLLVDPDPDPASAVLFTLRGGGYAVTARSRDGRLRFDEPFPADVDLG